MNADLSKFKGLHAAYLASEPLSSPPSLDDVQSMTTRSSSPPAKPFLTPCQDNEISIFLWVPFPTQGKHWVLCNGSEEYLNSTMREDMNGTRLKAFMEEQFPKVKKIHVIFILCEEFAGDEKIRLSKGMERDVRLIVAPLTALLENNIVFRCYTNFPHNFTNQPLADDKFRRLTLAQQAIVGLFREKATELKANSGDDRADVRIS